MNLHASPIATLRRIFRAAERRPPQAPPRSHLWPGFQVDRHWPPTAEAATQPPDELRNRLPQPVATSAATEYVRSPPHVSPPQSMDTRQPTNGGHDALHFEILFDCSF